MTELHEPNKVIDIDLQAVAKRSLLITVLSLVVLLALKMIIVKEFSFTITWWSVAFFIIGYVVLIVLHELFHLLGFRIFAGVPWKRMIIGVNLKLGIAYATTDHPNDEPCNPEGAPTPFLDDRHCSCSYRPVHRKRISSRFGCFVNRRCSW